MDEHIDDRTRTMVSVSLDRELVEAVTTGGLELSSVIEDGLRRRLRAQASARRWAEDNREAIEHSNAELERDGLWSDGLRLFRWSGSRSGRFEAESHAGS